MSFILLLLSRMKRMQTGRSNYKCRFNKLLSVTNVASWRNIQPGDELALQQAVALYGPVSVAINAGLASFQVGPKFFAFFLRFEASFVVSLFIALYDEHGAVSPQVIRLQLEL
jgi:hypothetical protein